MQLFLLLCLVLLSPQEASLHRHHPRETKKRVKDLHVGATVAPSSRRDFTFDLYRALASAAPSQNRQILEGLGLDLQKSSEEQLHRGFQQLLQELNQPRDGFQLSLDSFPTNFGDSAGALKQINDYVAKQTKGKIVDLLKNLDSNAVMVMVNYIFFKAKWETSFNHKGTQEQDFYVTPETVVRVPMMSREDQYHYLLDRNLSCRVVGVPYQGNATALFILPSEGKMQQVENGLSEKTLRKWLKMFKKRQLELYLPKFSIEGSYQLDKILPKLGISNVFTSHADLSALTTHLIHLSMVHKAVVEVDESGTRAAAATGTIFMFRSARLSSQKIVFNRPFLMFIVDNDILFLGKVNRP
uniref:Serpin family A member 5 n=1 Tax=Macaca fascicularis TaxID=9541 RepID=A0A2K5WKC8_MACFA